jgi:hypothetical protein
MPANATHKWRLRKSNFDESARALLGESTDRGIAARLDTDHTVLSQVRAGNRAPTARFMAACKREMPGIAFEHLFELVEVDESERVA